MHVLVRSVCMSAWLLFAPNTFGDAGSPPGEGGNVPRIVAVPSGNAVVPDAGVEWLLASKAFWELMSLASQVFLVPNQKTMKDLVREEPEVLAHLVAVGLVIQARHLEREPALQPAFDLLRRNAEIYLSWVAGRTSARIGTYGGSTPAENLVRLMQMSLESPELRARLKDRFWVDAEPLMQRNLLTDIAATMTLLAATPERRSVDDLSQPPAAPDDPPQWRSLQEFFDDYFSRFLVDSLDRLPPIRSAPQPPAPADAGPVQPRDPQWTVQEQFGPLIVYTNGSEQWVELFDEPICQATVELMITGGAWNWDTLQQVIPKSAEADIHVQLRLPKTGVVRLSGRAAAIVLEKKGYIRDPGGNAPWVSTDAFRDFVRYSTPYDPTILPAACAMTPTPPTAGLPYVVSAEGKIIRAHWGRSAIGIKWVIQNPLDRRVQFTHSERTQWRAENDGSGRFKGGNWHQEPMTGLALKPGENILRGEQWFPCDDTGRVCSGTFRQVYIGTDDDGREIRLVVEFDASQAK